MQIQCPACAASFETSATWGPKTTEQCPKCGRAIARDAAAASPRGEGTVPFEAGTHAFLESLEGQAGDATAVASKGLGLALPKGKRISLLQLSGPHKGDLIHVARPRVVLGRLGGGADAELADPEISRSHAAFECYGPRMVVRDLGSRNGTFVKEQQVQNAPLEEHSEFRIGSTILMVVVTEAE